MSKNYENQEALISHLRKGKEEAYRYFIRHYNQRLLHYAVSLTNDHAMAQDIVQEVFVDVWKKRKSLDKKLSLKSFVYKMTYHKFINQYHKKRATSSLERAYVEAINEAFEEDNAELLEKKIALVTEAIKQLPKKCKQAFLLSKEDGLTNIEIAEYMDVSIKTVEGHLTRAYESLRNSVGEQLKTLLFLLFGKRLKM